MYSERAIHGSSRTLDLVSVTAWFALCVPVGYKVWLACAHSAWSVALAALLAFLITDAISGIVHWAADTYGNARTPLFGPSFIQPFREHHTDQMAITRHDFLETNGNNCLVSLPALLLAWWLPLEPGDAVLSFFTILLFFACAWVLATNQIHKWAHQENPPPLVALLQRVHLILPPQHHAIHHGEPFTRNYCITNGWMNAPLAAIGFFPAMEWLLDRAVGLKPRPGEDDAEAAFAHAASAAAPVIQN